jgi:hypothetical protein
VGLVLLGSAWPAPLGAQVDATGEPLDPGPVFLVSQFKLEYRNPHPDQPALEKLLPISVRLGTSPSGFVAYTPDRPSTQVEIGKPGAALPYHPGAIGAVTASVLALLQQKGLIGVYVEPHPDDLDVENERDLRPPGDTELVLVITTSRVLQVRTIGGGDRIRDEWRIDNRIHDRIRRRSPIQPAGADSEETTDLADRKVLDDYLFRLNRHPGRRVDAALAPAESGEGVSLDYLVQESKPWYVYAQVSNTGTSATGEWQQRFGYVNLQVTDRDDTFAAEYFRSGLNDLNGVSVSYEAPWFDAQRPWWWSRPADGPSWLEWWDRSRWPWFGSDFLRWRVWGHYLDYEADLELGEVGDEAVDGVDWDVGAQLIYNVFQYRAFFVDFFAGADARGVKVDNDPSIREAEHFFLLPHAGLDFERITPVSNLLSSFRFEGNVIDRETQSIDSGGDPAGGLEALGRSDPDDQWIVAFGDLGFSQFLEPVLNPRGWGDPSTSGSSTLAHEIFLGGRGQYAFGYRLIPQAERVVGGLYTVRGYQQSAAVGDDFAVGTFEYRFHLPHSLPVDREPLQVPLVGRFRVSPQQVYGRPDWDFILRGFFDVGVTRSNDRPPRSSSGVRLEPGEFLMGAGAGAELTIRNNLRARVDWGMALEDTQSTVNRVDAGDYEFHLLFTILY